MQYCHSVSYVKKNETVHGSGKGIELFVLFQRESIDYGEYFVVSGEAELLH